MGQKEKKQTFWKNFWEFIIYSLVGLATTVVSYGVRLLILRVFSVWLGIDLNSEEAAMVARASGLRSAAQTAGWVAGVLFAFFPNKVLVFRNREWGAGKILRQFGSFTLSRVGTYLLELGLAVLLPIILNSAGYSPFSFAILKHEITVDADGLTMVVSIILVTAINYIVGKLIVFRSAKR